LPLLAWGYLQYRLTGDYRARIGGGGPGISIPPDRIVESGPYRYIRNPMYLGHLVFFLGLAVVLRSWIALAVFVLHAAWFDRRVREDEARLAQLFGDAYRDYCRRVKRWIPGVY
jgi:protein-S-isoprenylcysteine O-methyltransferase Ste14